MMKIRRGRKADMERVRKFLRRVQIGTFYEGFQPDTQKFREDYQNLCNQHSRNMGFCELIIDDQHRVHGALFGVVMPMFGLRADYATDLLFVTDEEGKRLGGFLFKRFLAWGKDVAGNVIVASTHGCRPEHMKRFYERFGLAHLGPVFGAKG